jgi:peptidoglycan/xylan/chitin deacetylase (PgdA/CDA1 family)
MIRLYRPLFIGPLIYKRALFRMNTTEKVLSLSFDDGPFPVSTEEILAILGKMNVGAIFFCSGLQARAHPGLMEKIRSAGHIIGNHGFHHLNGFTTPFKKYIENAVSASPLTSGTFFRPPYGWMTPRQYSRLSKSFRLIMWDIMCYDFDRDFGKDRSLETVKRKIRPGSIIVLHDTPASTASQILEELIVHCRKEGYRFVVPD